MGSSNAENFGTSAQIDKPSLTLDNVQNGADEISDVSNKVGIIGGSVLTATAGPEAGLPVLETAGRVSDIATVVSAGIDMYKGNTGNGIAKLGGVAVSNLAGHLIGTKALLRKLKWWQTMWLI